MKYRKERVYYRVCFEDKTFSPHTFSTLTKAMDFISSCNNLDSLDDWLAKGKSKDDWLYWKELYTSHTYIEQVCETVYHLS